MERPERTQGEERPCSVGDDTVDHPCSVEAHGTDQEAYDPVTQAAGATESLGESDATGHTPQALPPLGGFPCPRGALPGCVIPTPREARSGSRGPGEAKVAGGKGGDKGGAVGLPVERSVSPAGLVDGDYFGRQVG